MGYKTPEERERDNAWDYLVSNCIATEEELRLVTSICGFTLESINDVLYVRTGYRNIEQMDESYA